MSTKKFGTLIEYEGDFSNALVDNALVTKSYVLNQIASAGTSGGGSSNITASNGLTKNVNDIVLGGNLTQNTTVSSTTFNLDFEKINGTIESYLLLRDGGIILERFNTGVDNYIEIDENSARLIGSNQSESSSFEVQPDGEIIVNSDFSNFAGIKYNSNYSANYTNRSLVDKEFVINQLFYASTAGNNNSIAFNIIKYSAVTNNQTSSDPGNGIIKWNNSTLTSSTELYFDDVSYENIDLSNYFSKITVDAIIYVQKTDNASIYQRWSITSVTDNSGWWTFGVSFLDGSGPINQGDVLAIAIGSVGTNITASNGLTKSNNNITLGGSLTSATVITTGDFGLTINASASTSGYGLKYASDYSSQFTNRSLVDKEFVINAIANGSGDFASTSGYALSAKVTQSFSMGISSSTTITTGAKGRYPIAYRGKMVAWRLIANTSCNVVLDIWKSNNAVPTNANSIFGTKPSLVAQELNSSTGLNIDVAKGDIFILEVESNDVALYLKIDLEIESF